MTTGAFVFYLVWALFQIGSHVAQDGLELSIAKNGTEFMTPCLSLPNTGFTGMRCHAVPSGQLSFLEKHLRKSLIPSSSIHLGKPKKSHTSVCVWAGE